MSRRINFSNLRRIRFGRDVALSVALLFGSGLASNELSAQTPAPSPSQVVQQPSAAQAPPGPAVINAPSAKIEALPPVNEVVAPAILSLADLENLATQNNPSLAQFVAKANALRGKWEQAGLGPNPYAGYSGQQIGSGNTVEQRGLVFGKEIVTGGKLGLSQQMIAQEIARAEQEVTAQRFRVLTDVRVGYYEVLISQHRTHLAQEIVDNLASAVTTNQKRFEGKSGSKPEVLQATIEYESATVLKRRSENQHLEAWRKLTAVMGTPTLPLQPLGGTLGADLPLYDWNSSLQRLLVSSPEVAAAEADVQRARWAYQRACAERTPNISFQGIAQYDQSIDGPNGAAQVTFPIPFRNKNQGAITQAGHEAIVAEQALCKLQLDLQYRLAAVFQRYDSARTQVERYSKVILPSAQENLELTRKLFQAGEFDYLQLLLAQRTSTQTNLDYLAAEQEARTVALEIEGLLLSQSLRANP